MCRLTGYSLSPTRGKPERKVPGKWRSKCVPHDSKTQLCAFELSKHIQVHCKVCLGNIAYLIA